MLMKIYAFSVLFVLCVAKSYAADVVAGGL